MNRALALAACLLAALPGAVRAQELPFSPARWAGDLLFVSGQVGNLPGEMQVVPGGIRAETRQALENVRRVLADHGATMDDVVKCTAMLDDIAEWGAMNEVYVGFFDPPRPARSALGTDGLALGARVEIECISHLPRVVAPALPAAGLDNGSFEAEVDGRLIHYAVHGAGPPLMVVTNSWGLSLEGLRGLLGGLEERLTMIYFDPRGMGESGPASADEDLSLAAVRDDFHRVRRHLGLARVHALGWSNGATNLVWLARDSPESVASAVFLHGFPRFGPGDMAAVAERYPELIAEFGATQERLEGGGLSPAQQDSALRELYLGRWFPTMLARPEATRDRLDRAFADAELSWRHARYAEREVPELDQRPLLAEIRVPSLVIAGAHDALPPERAEELAVGLPRARFVVFDDSGHFAPIEEPHRFVDLVTQFLRAGE